TDDCAILNQPRSAPCAWNNTILGVQIVHPPSVALLGWIQISAATILVEDDQNWNSLCYLQRGWGVALSPAPRLWFVTRFA
ncbi:MAG: hypothetical protein JXB30_16835, partial [Anaerolineae bacterium]|nr:hypothetical protein [Anaerolineae bacterium]